MNLNVDQLTMSDLDAIEQISGQPIGKLFDGEMSVGHLKAIAVVLSRKTPEPVTPEEVADWPLSRFVEYIGAVEGSAPDPTVPPA